MILKFDDMPLAILPQFKGGEGELRANMFFDGTNRILKGILVPGASIGVHKHEGNCEMIYVLSGCGTLLERDSEGLETMSYVTSGDCLYCPEGYTHSLMNTSYDEDLVFFAVVPKQ